MSKLNTNTLIDNRKVILLENVLTFAECNELITLAENENEFTTAKISAGYEGSIINEDIRNSSRLVIEDKELSNKLFHKIKDFLPKKWYMNDKFIEYELYKLNDRLKFLKYEPGQKFSKHCDANFSLDDSYCPEHLSLFTCQFYLNEVEIGGETTFYKDGGFTKDLTIKPKIGQVVIFEQEDLVHEGSMVRDGVKYVIRCDVMYRKSNGLTIFPH